MDISEKGPIFVVVKKTERNFLIFFNMYRDLRNTALYVINGIICNYKDYTGVYPTIEVVKGIFDYPKYASITDNEIQDIINRVIRIDNK